MTHSIDHEHRAILDSILPNFELNEVINIKKCIRSTMDDT